MGGKQPGLTKNKIQGMRRSTGCPHTYRRVQCESDLWNQNSPNSSLRPDEGTLINRGRVCGRASLFACRSCCWRYPWRRPLVRAQGEASISGVATDATGSAIPQATIRIINTEKGAVRTILTDDAGRYEAPLLAVGTYEVSAEKAGFNTAKRSVSLVLGQHANVDLTLSVAGIRQAIQVEAAPFAPDVTTADVSGLVNERQVKDLPLNGRSYDQLLTLNPGVINYTSQRAGGIGTSNSVVGNMFAVSGRRPQENLYLLNGVEFTSASEVNNTPGGTSGQLLGVDAVREFAVVKDTYGAEYGKRPGAQINIVDRLRLEPVARQRLRVPAQQRPGRAEFLRSGANSQLRAQ